MQCSLFQSLLRQAVESHADSVSPEVRTHATACTNPACVEAWAEQTLLDRVVEQWKSELPQVDLSESVLNELFPPQPQPEAAPVAASVPALKAYVEQSWRDFRSPQLRSWSMALSVVGVLLCIGTLIVLVPHSPNAEIAVRQRNNPVAAPAREEWATHTPRPPRHDGSPNVAAQSVEWAQKASSVMASAIVSLPERGTDWVPRHGWDAPHWQHQLEPLRRDAHAAWETLIDNLPMPERPAS